MRKLGFCLCKNRVFAYAKIKAQISCAATAQLISTFVFATWIVQFLLYLNPKFQISTHIPQMHRLVCVRPGQKPWTGFLVAAHFNQTELTLQEEDKKSYGDLMSSLLSYYVDLRLVHARYCRSGNIRENLIFANWLPREFKVLANIVSL